MKLRSAAVSEAAAGVELPDRPLGIDEQPDPARSSAMASKPVRDVGMSDVTFRRFHVSWQNITRKSLFRPGRRRPGQKTRRSFPRPAPV
jgi:hypothetical protein